ncbi:MAG: hypothetical protein K6F96_06230 [Bacteroidales bacterium]|nr:hypothetical protein [Bacteroidales bacterium]
MRHFIVPIALLACIMATSCNTNKRLYETGVAYHQANQADHERIMELKSKGSPDAWPEIFERYCSIKGRSDEMAHFPPEVKRELRFMPLDLNDELTQARNKAEAYLAAKAGQVLSGQTPDVDEADRLIRHLERVNRDNKQINDLKLKSLARRYGDISRMMHIEVFERQVGPNRDETVSFKESQGGMTATVTDHKLSKTATIKGKVNFIEPKKRRIVFSMPYEVSSNFEHTYSTVDGPQAACSAQTLENLKRKPVPFPTDESLIEDAQNKLVDLIYQKIQ